MSAGISSAFNAEVQPQPTVTALRFGATPATSFAVGSEGQITAVTPTPTCTVPKLGGKKLKAAKNSLRTADCKLGNVKKLMGATARTGRVKKQSPKPGKVLAARSRVGVWLSGKGVRR